LHTLKEAAQAAAERELRTLSGLIERLLIEHCESAGTLAKPRSKRQPKRDS
jgi:hypothetical protein